MGRGRSKAKHTKVARDLKYSNQEMDLERLTKEFPRFEDVSTYKGDQIQIYKLAQLGIWMMHLTLSPRKAWKLEDAHLLTAFADYIVPVGMRVMGIFEYAPELEKQINRNAWIPALVTAVITSGVILIVTKGMGF
jgi:hypothetical protein